MSFQSIFLATVALAIASPLAAQEPAPTPTPTPATETAKVKPPRPVCRLEASSGTHFQKRICHSAQEWAAIDAAQSGAPRRDGSRDYGR